MAIGCGVDEPTAERYLGDGAFRRGVLERSLWRPDLPYSRSLLASYALGDAGWDLLSPMTELTALVTRADSEALQAGRALSLDDAEPVAGAGSDVDALPSDEAAWVEGDDVDELRVAIDRALATTHDAAARARRIALATPFDWETCARRTLEVWRTVVATTPPRRG